MMKVMCRWAASAPLQIRSGWGRALTYCGHHFAFWNPDTKSAHDAFAEFEPDWYIGETYSVDRAVAKCIAARPAMKVSLFASAWGPLADALPVDEFPIVRVTDEEKRAIEALKRGVGKPDYVFIHTADSGVEDVLGGWRSIGVTPVGILNGADVFVYFRGQYRPEMACDLGVCSGYWGYKAKKLDQYLLPLCHPSAKLTVKIFGNSPWPVAQYLGYIPDSYVNDLFASATVCPNVSEPHSTDPRYGRDIVERPFKVMSSGGFCISDHVPEIRELFSEEELLTADSPSVFADMVRHFVKHPEERAKYMAAGTKAVLAAHTYFHRAAKMLKHLGCEADASACMASYEKWKGK